MPSRLTLAVGTADRVEVEIESARGLWIETGADLGDRLLLRHPPLLGEGGHRRFQPRRPPKDEPHRGVVMKVTTDSRQRKFRLDADLAQLAGVTDPRS